MTLEKGYPFLQRRFGKLTAYIQLVRPFTLLAPLVAGVLGVLSTVQITFQTVYTAIYVGITLALAQATGQIINQYADFRIDKMTKPYRPIPSGLISAEEALGIAWLLAIFSIARAFTIDTMFGLTIIVLIFFAVFYSLSPFSPRKIHSLLNVGWMAVSRGFIPILAVWSIYGDWTRALPYALLAFVWVLGFQGAKDVDDSEADWTFGIKTVVNSSGVEGLRALMFSCGIIYFGLCALFELYLLCILLLVGGLSIYGLTKKSKVTENNIGWLLFYAGLALLYLLMFINEVSGF